MVSTLENIENCSMELHLYPIALTESFLSTCREIQTKGAKTLAANLESIRKQAWAPGLRICARY